MDFGLLYENDEGEYVLLNDVCMADIRLASLVYLPCLFSTYYVPIALLCQNKPFPLLYLGHAQIIITKKIRLKILLKLSNKASHPFFYTAHNVLLTPPLPPRSNGNGLF